MSNRNRSWLVVTLACLFGGVSGSLPAAAGAEEASIGRFTPSQPGSAGFWVDEPSYQHEPTLGAALTLDYAHDPLVLGVRDASGFTKTGALIEHQLMGHLQVAASFARRLVLGLSMPVVLWEDGQSRFGLSPADGASVGDFRVSALLRLVGDARKDAYSAHLGVGAFLPTSGQRHNGDESVRLQARLLFAGRVSWFRWGWSGGYVYRQQASLGSLPASPGNTVGSELEFAARLGWASPDDVITVAPEVVLASSLPDGRYLQRSYTGFEAALGGHVRFRGGWVLSAAPGIGVLNQPGTPDFRFLLRVAWAPQEPPPLEEEDPEPVVSVPVNDPPPPPPPDGDEDDIVDAEDACPADKGVASADPAKHGCPPDGDGDGVADATDVCPSVPAGAHPDPARTGCPLTDSDADGIFDPFDLCPQEPVGPLPDPAKKGCPLPDRDADTVGDADDACPDKAGAPHPDARKNGCPGLVQVREGKLVILKPVFFATNRDKVLAKSFAVLSAVADALLAQPQVRRIRVEGHTDDRGNAQKNTLLSQRRAESVRMFLINRGVAAERLEAVGYGPSEPIETNKTSRGRAANRRVEFEILERQEVTP